ARPSTTAPPLMPTATTTGRSRAVGRLRIRRSHRIAIMSSPAATLRNGILLPPASTSRRWWARILDAFFVLVFTGFIIGLAFALYGADAISIDAAARVALITYPLMVLLFGALYGCTVSPGQALCGVVSLQTAHGRRVGFWRGMGRDLAIGFFPIALLLLVWICLDAPASVSAPMRACRRTAPAAQPADTLDAGGKVASAFSVLGPPIGFEETQPHLAHRRIRGHGVPEAIDRHLADDGDRGGLEHLRDVLA